MVLAQVANHAHEMHPDHVASETEKERLPQAQQPGIAPEEVHAQGQDCIAKILPVQVDAEVTHVQETAGWGNIEAGQHNHQNKNCDCYPPFLDIPCAKTHTVNPSSGCE